LHDFVAVGVMRTELAPLGRVQAALEQGAYRTKEAFRYRRRIGSGTLARHVLDTLPSTTLRSAAKLPQLATSMKSRTTGNVLQSMI
jgi:hypothetical protein